MLRTKFRVNWPFGSGEEAKNRFSKWPPWISDQNDFSYFDLNVTLMLPTEFQVNWPLSSGEEGKKKKIFKMAIMASWFSNRKDFSFFWATSLMLPTKFKSTGLSVQEKKQKIDFQDSIHSGHLGFQIVIILAIFDLQVTLMLPTKFQVNRLFGSGEEVKNRFSRWRPWPPSWISDLEWLLAIFDLQVTSMLPTKFQVNGLSVQKKRNNDFQDGRHGSHLGFPIRTTLAIFDLPVTQMLPTKFWVSWPLGSGEKVKNRFSRWLPWRPSWISNQNDFSYFWSISHTNASYQVSSQLAFGFKRRSKK